MNVFLVVVAASLVGVLGSAAGCTFHYLIFGDRTSANAYAFPLSLAGFLSGWALVVLALYASGGLL